MPSSDPLSVSDLLAPDTVRVGLPSGDKDDVLNAVIDLLRGHPHVEDLGRVRDDVFERERQMSTGVGLGLALPHARSVGASGTAAALAVTAEPVAFGAHDGEPVRLFFLLVGPDGERGRHIRLLGRVSRLMNQDAFRHRLLGAGSSDEVLTLFREADSRLAL